MRAVLVSLALLAPGARAWVLPGTAPRQFVQGARVDLKVNKLTSPRTHLGYEYYTMPFCRVRAMYSRRSAVFFSDLLALTPNCCPHLLLAFLDSRPRWKRDTFNTGGATLDAKATLSHGGAFINLVLLTQLWPLALHPPEPVIRRIKSTHL